MKEILILEEKLRFSDEYQAKYSEKDSLTWFRDVTLDLQQRALREAGGVAEVDMKEALKALHNARRIYKDDPELGRITVYQRLDRSREGSLQADVACPNVPLVTAEGATIWLHDYMAQATDNWRKVMIIMAGSLS